MAVKLKSSNSFWVINLTPLIDVIFLLLIFFLVAARLDQSERELDVPLPSAASALPMVSEPNELVINIDKAGSYIVAGAKLDADGLERAIQQAVADNPLNLAVMIRAHRSVELQVPVTAMDICQRCKAGYSLSIAEEES
ncbi:MAG: biopolymer transporter ExbD [Pirellulaceae bacterium]|nr:biopolymer transporter ExbD [Pirellulaceae bacterium]